MGKKQLSIMFFIKRTKLLKNGEAPVAIRITHGGDYAESQIGRSVPVKLWSQSKSRSVGKNRAATELNSYLEMIRVKIHGIHQELERSGELYSAKLIRDFYTGKGIEVKTLYSVFKEHNEKYHKLAGSGVVVVKTADKYDRCLKYLMEYIKIQYKKDDVALNEINPAFVQDFEIYLKTEKACAHNSTIKYLKRLKKIVTYARANNWMACDPFVGVKFKETPVHKDFLTQDEIDLIANKDIKIERLNVVRDVFLFCCHTGLAFVDVSNLRKSHITKDSNGEVWIRKTREKTNNMCGIPLLPTAEKILEKYKNHTECTIKDVLLPVLCNQKMNAYLKEIADICGITKKVTTHTARHTFASIISMPNGADLTNLSSMMGHTTTRQTQHYAKAQDSSIMRDMKNVAAALANRNQAALSANS